jgi:hypothetical protein
VYYAIVCILGIIPVLSALAEHSHHIVSSTVPTRYFVDAAAPVEAV